MKGLEKIIPDLQEVFPDVVDQIQSGKGDLVTTAKSIFNRSVSMQKSVTGWAEAFSLAFEHSKNAPVVKSDSSLKRRLNNLKKKTALSGKTSKADERRVTGRKLYDKAKAGDLDDKDKYVMSEILPSLGFK